MTGLAIVEPGATIGIVGGGQLGRMLAVAAAQLGYRCHIFAPEVEQPAAEVAIAATCAGYDDFAALDAFAAAVDVVTYEFENVPVAAIARLAGRVPVRPGARALEVAQDRLIEKQFIVGLGGRPAPFRAVDSLADLKAAVAALGDGPAILKTRRLGYDGKGQARLRGGADAETAWAAIGGAAAVLEGFVDFTAEFSLIVARAADGAIRFWDAPVNVHENGILARSSAPADAALAPAIAEATDLARSAAEALDYVGVMAMEFFATPDGPVFNEMAPRVHNSGHWTIEGARTSQFENHIRAVCGLPLGATQLAAPGVEMRNLIGDEVRDWCSILADPTAHLHLYGKSEARPGRKMGHVTRLLD